MTITKVQTTRIVTSLIVLDIAWSLIAFFYDYSSIVAIPHWARVFVVICPIYPALLAACWDYERRHKAIPALLLALSSIASVTYGVLALAFYPTIMHYVGWDWINFGQIFWVLFYALQGLYFLRRKKFSLPSVLIMSIFLIASLSTDYRWQSFGYLGVSDLPKSTQFVLFLFGICTIIAVSTRALRGKHATEKNN